MFTRRTLGVIGLVWGLAGVMFLLGGAVMRLAPLAMEVTNYHLTAIQWLALVANIVFMAWSEGYKGFQRAFSPRVAARLHWLFKHPCPLLVISAPLFCLGLIHSTTKRRLVFLFVTAMVITLIVLVRMLDQPWRGVIDVGVVVGLTWGIVSLLWYVVLAFVSKEFNHSPELPAETSRAYESYCAHAGKSA